MLSTSRTDIEQGTRLIELRMSFKVTADACSLPLLAQNRKNFHDLINTACYAID